MIVTLSPLTALPSERSASNGTILHTPIHSTVTLYLQIVKDSTARKYNKVTIDQQATGSFVQENQVLCMHKNTVD